MSKKLFLILIIVLAVSSIVCDQLNSSLYPILKPVTTILIISMAFVHKKEKFQKYNKLILVGLVCCLFGDVFLLKPEYFVWGLGAFLVGHFLFSEAFRSFKGVKFSYPEIAILGVIGIGIFAFIYEGLGEFMVPAAIYIAVIVYMGWMGICFHKSKVYSYSKWIPLAVMLFMFSDILISIDKFKWPVHEMGIPILITYWASIYLIAESITGGTETEKLAAEND